MPENLPHDEQPEGYVSAHDGHDTDQRHTHRFVGRGWALNHRDVRDYLAKPPLEMYDGVLCDPPYGLGFMGHGWDKAVPPVEVWSQLLKTCKPGAHLLAFGGPRTAHRLTCHIEDARWELRDTVYWVHGEGFPKSLNIGKTLEKLGEDAGDWYGYGTGLKPAVEPITVARKPLEGTLAENVRKHGCGALNIDGCRIGTSGGTRRSHQAPYPRAADGHEDRTNSARTGHSVEVIDEGRWPANLILDETAAELLDQQSGPSRSRRSKRRLANSNVGNGRTMGRFRSRFTAVEGYDDEGGASRYFYVAKASKRERAGNDHPTVKPLALCEYLARLILPPQRQTPRRLLVPFSGSGSEVLGGLRAGWDHVTGIEMDRHFCEVAVRRLSGAWQRLSPHDVASDTGGLPASHQRRPASESEARSARVEGCSEPVAMNTVSEGDCYDLIPELPDRSINLVVTSPPYAEQRKKCYPGVPEGRYAEFTVGWMARLWDKLADDASVLVVLDPHVKGGVMADYVLRTQLALRGFGWMQHRTQIWYKPDVYPLGHKSWPRHVHENILWFSKGRKPYCDPWACGRPTERAPWVEEANKVRKGIARSMDVFIVPVGANEKGVDHPARFPVPLAERLVQTFCPEQGTVLDPFCGSGSSLIAAKRHGCRYYGFDVVADFCRLARRRLVEEAGDERMQVAG